MSSLALSEPVEHLLVRQDGVARLDQLVAVGMTSAEIARQIAWGRWQGFGSTVVVAHNGPLTPAQQQWASVLGAGRRAALCGRSAAAHHGLDGWDDGRIHVLVERGTTPPAMPLPLAVHESRRYLPWIDAHPVRVPPMTRVDRSVVDAAAWTRHPRSACGLVIAGVQQRLTNPGRLLEELRTVGAVRHRRLLSRVLADVEGGAQALSEVDFGRMCRRHGLPIPVRQSVRLDPQGRRRYIDVELRTRRGRQVLVEIDGAAHLIVGTYWSDMARANEIVIAGQSLLRFPTVALYLDESTVVDQLRRSLDD
ncbi:MAG: hypothetical protein ACRDVN_02690 [Jiangellaceae bacterium]